MAAAASAKTAGAGSQSYTTPGTYSWIAPIGVNSVSVVAIGGGGGGSVTNAGVYFGFAGNGGDLAYKNNIAVIPGRSYAVVVGAGGTGAPSQSNAGGNGGTSYFNSTGTVSAGGGTGGSTYVCGGGGCFLAGSLITMADGSLRRIENVYVGEYVLGAFGEINKVIALDNPIVAARYMYKINDEHYTYDDHPHMSPDKKFYSCDVDAICDVWGRSYACKLGDGSVIPLKNRGLDNPREKIKKLTVGTQLLHRQGSKTVTSIQKEIFDYNTPLYNFVLSGSHTYYVNGYCVTGWPREDDFDYLSWQKKDIVLDIGDYQ
jgi:hypothetical protein